MSQQILQSLRIDLKIAMLIGLALVLSACMQKKEMVEEMAPEPEPMMEEEEPAPMVATDDVYIVAPGDSLWSISGMPSIYNDPFRWPLIYGRNKDIEDADLIYPDQELLVPRDLMRTDIDKAIEHAKTRGAWSIGEVEEADSKYRESSM